MVISFCPAGYAGWVFIEINFNFYSMNNNLNPDKFEELFRQELEAVTFPVHESVAYLATHILRNFSLAQLGTDVETYESIAESSRTQVFNLYNVSYVLNGISSRSANDLSVSIEEYVEIQKLVFQESKKWNADVAPIRAKLMNKLQTQQALAAPNIGKNVIPNGRRR